MTSFHCAFRRLQNLLLALAWLALLTLPLLAQTSNGSIVGTVKDSTGAIIPGAAVTLTNPATADKRTAVTDDNGNYRFVNLVPANYRLDIELSGFKHLTREPIVVQVESTVRIDAALQVGNISETVEVTSETPLLQTETSSLSHIVESKTVQEMPLNGRNVMNLIALVPGVVPQGSTSGTIVSNQSAGHTNNNAWNNYQIGGGIAGHSSAYLDGAPTIGLGNNTVTLIATQDAVQEFRVATSNVSPEYGRFGGGVVNMATKSGANQFHGSAYEYFRNKVLNANTFFGNMLGQPTPAFNQNQYGTTLGGPVRKDKTFFFFSWEQFRAKIGTTNLTFVPTDAQRAGDFSASLGGPLMSGGTAVINPCTGQQVLQGQIFDPLTTKNVGGKNCRTPFPGNRIPANRIDGTADVIANKIKYWPSPNTDNIAGNFSSTPNPGGTQQQFNARVDENISERQRFFARFTYWTVNDISMNRLGNTTGGAASNQATHQAVLGDTYSFNPTLIMEGRLSFTRAYYDDLPPSLGFDLGQLGAAWATLNPLVTFREQPTPNVSGLYAFGGMNVTSAHYRNTWALSGNLTKLHGRHQFKFGGEARLMDYNYGQSTNPSGNFVFDRGFTTWDGTTAASTGIPFASFMLGYPTRGTLGTIQMVGQYSWYQGYYFGDTYQMTSKLTFNYGVRWELPGAYAERRDRATILKPDMPDPLAASTGLPLKGQLVFVNSPEWPDRTTQKVRWNLIAPRVGFAYRVRNSTVIRAGYGISYLPMDLAGGAPSQSPIVSASTAMVASVNNANLVPLNTLSNPFPAGGVPGTVQQSILLPSGRNQAYLNSLEGLSISGAVPEQPYGYAQQWNFNIQQELLAGLLFEIGYSGSKGTHLPIGGLTLNQLNSVYYSMGSALLTQVNNPMAGKLNPTSSLNGAKITQGQLLRPYPQFTNVSNAATRVGDTNYHSMQVRLEKRFGAAGMIAGNYTWSKFIGNTDTSMSYLEKSPVGTYQDNNNLRGERSLLSFDVPHRVMASYVLELPFGKGRRYLGGVSGLAGALVSGWAVNGILNFQSGYPLALSAQATTLSSTFGAGTPRPNRVIGCDPVSAGSAQSRITQWFNTACFTQPGSYSFGNVGRTDPVLRTHGVNNIDVTLSKNTSITEQVRLQFKTEFFNLFNRVQFRAPGAALGLVTFGVVSEQVNQPRLIQFALRLVF